MRGGFGALPLMACVPKPVRFAIPQLAFGGTESYHLHDGRCNE
jgi:hypothetical protein